MTLDKGAIKELRDVRDRVAAVWPKGAGDILAQRNPNLLNELTRIEGVMDSILVLESWPAPIQKQWRTAISDYEKTAMLCVEYANRHIQLQGK